jgi:hypothetical protein
MLATDLLVYYASKFSLLILGVTFFALDAIRPIRFSGPEQSFEETI